MTEPSWQERNKIRGTNMAVWADMVADQLPRQFFGVDGNCLKLDGSVFEAVEDPDDGYRSSLDYVEPRSAEGKVFFGQPVDTVRLEEGPALNDGDRDAPYGQFHGWVLRSVKDGHVWLWFGTDNYDDYYPGFVFRYCPRLA